MAGTLTLYTQPNQQGAQTYNLGTFTFTDLEEGTDYTLNRLKKFTTESLGMDIYMVKLTLGSGGVANLDVNKNNQPFPTVPLIQNDDPETSWFYPENLDVTATAIATRPLDWDLNWRDEYTQVFTSSVTRGGTTYNFTTAALTHSTEEVMPFIANRYFKTGQGRHLYWTMSGCYFALENFWQVEGNAIDYYVRACSIGRYTYGSASYDNTWRAVNAIRERGVQGPYLVKGNSGDDINNFQINRSKQYTDFAPTLPRLYLNFVEFELPIELESGEIIKENMIGFCVWEEGIDGTVLNGQIYGITKQFWEGKPQPPYDGPTSHIEGGNGGFNRNSESRTGIAAGIASSWNASVGRYTQGYNKYVIDTTHGGASALTKFVQRILNPDSWLAGWENKFFNPVGCVIQYHLMPWRLAPIGSGSSQITAGGKNWTDDDTAPIWSDPFQHLNVGSYEIKEDSESFADYQNTVIIINLPYVGVYTIDVAAAMGQNARPGRVQVDYIADAWTGDVTAMVEVWDRNGNGWVRYQWKGNCAKSLPLTTYTPGSTRIAQGIIGAGLALGAGAIAAGSVGAIVAGSAAASRVTAALDDGGWISQNRPELIGQLAQRQARQEASSAFGSSALRGAAQGSSTIGTSLGSALNSAGSTTSSNASGGCVSSPIDTQCWILIVRPEWSAPDYYAHECGYPSDIAGLVKEFKGFLSTSTIELNGIDCTDTERAEIDSLMHAGIYLTDAVPRESD